MGLLSVLYTGAFGNSSLARSCMKAIIYLSRLLSATESLAAAGWGGKTLPGLSYLAVITLSAKVSESLSWVPGKVWIYSPDAKISNIHLALWRAVENVYALYPVSTGSTLRGTKQLLREQRMTHSWAHWDLLSFKDFHWWSNFSC